MKFKDIKNYLPNIIPAVIVFIVLGGFFVYTFLKISSLTKNVEILTTNLASTTVALSRNTDELSRNLTDLRSQTIGLSNTLSSTQQNVESVKTQVGGVEQTVGSISGKVNTLQKLSATDPELLKKYSKVYFLNENYTPAHLTQIPQEYVYSNTKQEQFLTEAWSFLQKLLLVAKNDNIPLYIKSGFRSFAEQQTLKSVYTFTYGAGTANSFAADQGYSEHQLGTATDFIMGGLNGELNNTFDNTTAFRWLIQNAYKFGFELSYPKGNSYYTYEPWHWRFVGVKLATYLHDQNKNYYDMDQRDIDVYLVNIFD
ncbi:MAG TPA: M15 family metallopeptidase [Candidatus Paceibacterota bacterium]